MSAAEDRTAGRCAMCGVPCSGSACPVHGGGAAVERPDHAFPYNRARSVAGLDAAPGSAVDEAPEAAELREQRMARAEERATCAAVPTVSTAPPDSPMALARAAVERAAGFRGSYELEEDPANPGRRYADRSGYDRALLAEQRAIKLLADCEAAEQRGIAAFLGTSAWREIEVVLREELGATPGPMKRIADRLKAVVQAAVERGER